MHTQFNMKNTCVTKLNIFLITIRHSMLYLKTSISEIILTKRHLLHILRKYIEIFGFFVDKVKMLIFYLSEKLGIRTNTLAIGVLTF